MEDLRIGYLSDFPIQTLAQISDWLDETGEVYVDTGVRQYFIRSLQDLRLIALQEGHRARLTYTIFRDPQFPLRGIADAALLERALQEFPEGNPFYVVTFISKPHHSDIDAESTHDLLRETFFESWGYPIAVGPPPPSVGANFVIEVRPLFPTRLKRPPYAPYDANPARYQWIIEMWRE